MVILDPQRADLFEGTLKSSRECSYIVIEGQEGKGRWEGMSDYADLMSQHAGDLESIITNDPDVVPEDNATIIFTSGTTGLPSGWRCPLISTFHSLGCV